eukprot:scaffold38270_cov61-Phaeocystis_antarctica.AAC.3
MGPEQRTCGAGSAGVVRDIAGGSSVVRAGGVTPGSLRSACTPALILALVQPSSPNPNPISSVASRAWKPGLSLYACAGEDEDGVGLCKAVWAVQCYDAPR